MNVQNETQIVTYTLSFIKRLALILIIFVNHTAQAETNEERKHFWYIEPGISLININDNLTYNRSWNLAWLYKHRVFVGVESIGQDHPIRGSKERWGSMGAYGGFRLYLLPRFLVSFDISLSTGTISYFYGPDPSPDNFYITTPRFSLILPLNRISEAALNFSYIYVYDSTETTYQAKDLGGPALGISMRFGGL